MAQSPPPLIPLLKRHLEGRPQKIDKETNHTRCDHCGGAYPFSRFQCPNCGAPIPRTRHDPRRNTPV